LAEKLQLGVGLDTGSRWTRCVIGVLEGDALRYAGHGQAPGAGWSKGRLADSAALSESIHAAVREAEEAAGVQVEWVTTGVGGTSIQGANSRGVYEFGRARSTRKISPTRCSWHRRSVWKTIAC
jgi:cell division protein FtsA